MTPKRLWFSLRFIIFVVRKFCASGADYDKIRPAVFNLGRLFAVLSSLLFTVSTNFMPLANFLAFVLGLRFDCAKPKGSENLTAKFR